MPIYKQYDQQALDRQYNNRLQTPGFAIHLQRWEDTSRETEKKFNAVRDIAYGAQEREKLDIYPSPKQQSKTLVFIHGGYWQKFDKSWFQFVAEAFLPYEFTIVLISYPLAPAANVSAIVSSCRKALQWVHENIHQYNGDPQELYVAGHSAGGHLAVMLMTDDREPANASSTAPLIKGVCAMSGLFDLEPIRLSELNAVLQLDEQEVSRNSPVHLSPIHRCPLVIAVGADETDEFIAQSESFCAAWQKQAVPMELLPLPGINHFSIVESFTGNNSLLHAAMLRLMNYREPAHLNSNTAVSAK